MSIHIGTAGYVYPHWRNAGFYPRGLPHHKELPHYLSNFTSVEINATWHAFPRLSTLQKWRTFAHPQTRFCLKAPSVITHKKRLRDVHQDILAFIRIAKEGLRDHLGPFLFQCPPSLPLSIPLLEQFLFSIRTASEHFGHIHVALEFRSPDWFCESVYRLLAENDVALVNNVAVSDNNFAVLHDLFPHTRGVKKPEASWKYNRFHGSKNPGVFTDFPDHILRPFAEQPGVQYSFFLNDWNAIAPTNAKTYVRLCAQARKAEIKTLLDGFRPEWSRAKPNIKSFFQQTASAKQSLRSTSDISKSIKHSHEDTKNKPAVPQKSTPAAKTKPSVKLLKPTIQKKRGKSKSRDIASFFPPTSRKG